jgi:PAS domain S-box-containing protein
MLKQRVFELEEKMKGGTHAVKVESKPDSGVFKLLKTKNEQLEEQREELRQTVEQLSLWMSTLRLYQEIFENEAAAMIGVNKDGKIVLFNRTAPQLLGESFKAALHKPIETVDFASFDASTPSLVRATLSNRRPSSRSVRIGDRQVTTTVYPLGSDKDPTGALLKIGVAPAEQLLYVAPDDTCNSCRCCTWRPVIRTTAAGVVRSARPYVQQLVFGGRAIVSLGCAGFPLPSGAGGVEGVEWTEGGRIIVEAI